MQTASSAPRKGALTRALSAPGTANGLILLGAVLQVLFFILYLINGDVHVDEAMLVLNARSLAREGTDIFGQRMPVYFDTGCTAASPPWPPTLQRRLSACLATKFGLLGCPWR